MIYPIKNFQSYKLGYTFGQPTYYSPHHLGVDIICPSWTPIYSPTKGIVDTVVNGTQGGVTLHFRDENDYVWRFMHLTKAEATHGWGKLEEGRLICYSGNTGSLVGNTPHVHIDISKHSVQINNFSNFIDPLLYLKEHTMSYKPNSIIFSKADKEFYWVKSDGNTLLFIPHDRLVQACSMSLSTPVEESLKDKAVGMF